MRNRLASLMDFNELYLFWEKAGLQLYSKDDEFHRYKYMLHLNPELCILLTNDKDEIIGSILGAFDGRTASVHRLAISPTLQKQGLGKSLLQVLERTLKEKGIKKLSAQIHISNTQVLPFYEKLGFQEMTYVKTFFKDL